MSAIKSIDLRTGVLRKGGVILTPYVSAKPPLSERVREEVAGFSSEMEEEGDCGGDLYGIGERVFFAESIRQYLCVVKAD